MNKMQNRELYYAILWDRNRKKSIKSNNICMTWTIQWKKVCEIVRFFSKAFIFVARKTIFLWNHPSKNWIKIPLPISGIFFSIAERILLTSSKYFYDKIFRYIFMFLMYIIFPFPYNFSICYEFFRLLWSLKSLLNHQNKYLRKTHKRY